LGGRKKKMVKVAIYARVSTTKQELDNQLNALRKYCNNARYEIVNEYTDIISGSKDSRPGFNKLFKDAHKRQFNLVVFWDISRFSRAGTLYTLQKLKELDNAGIKWHSYQEPYFSSIGQFKDVVLSIMATLAKMERERISERTKAGLVRARKEGKLIGRPRNDAVYKKKKVYTFLYSFNDGITWLKYKEVKKKPKLKQISRVYDHLTRINGRMDIKVRVEKREYFMDKIV